MVDLLGLPSEDAAISILRYFHWNQGKLEEEWFEKYDLLQVDIGLVYNKSLTQKYPDITASLAEKNSAMCGVCYSDFDDGGTNEVPFNLGCGH